MSYNRYINNFPNESEFTKYIEGSLADMPNTALIDDTGEMKYTKSLADYYVLSGTTTGTTDFMIGSLIDGDYTPDCIQVHVVQKPDGNNEMYVKPSDVLKTPFNLSHQAGFTSTEGNKITSISKWKIDTSYVSNMNSMFGDCSSLTSLDLSNFNTSNVTDMGQMFSSCSSLNTLDLSNFNTSNVTKMNSMFSSCSSLNTLDLSNFNTSNVTDMSSMFYSCSSLNTIDLSNFNTSNVTDMGQMFHNCTKLASLDLRSFDTRDVKYMFYMFSGCSSLTSLDLRNFDTTSVIQMASMFSGCYKLNKLYLSSSFFNSTSITKYDFSDLTAWTDANSLAQFVEAITAHDGTGKTVALSIKTKSALTQTQKDAITAKGWTMP